jgi:hypothetical protein
LATTSSDPADRIPPQQLGAAAGRIRWCQSCQLSLLGCARAIKDKRDAECETLHAEQMAQMRRSKAAHSSMSGSLPSLGGKARFCDRRHMTNGAPALLSTSSDQSSPAVNRWDQVSGLN